MDFFVNDGSIHNQFQNKNDAFNALNGLFKAKRAIHNSGKKLYISLRFSSAPIQNNEPLLNWLKKHKSPLAIPLLKWFTNCQPTWENKERHPIEAYLHIDKAGSHLNEEVITDSGLGEAAWKELMGESAAVVSVSPSHFDFTPIRIKYFQELDKTQEVSIQNFWEMEKLENFLVKLISFTSWSGLENYARKNFSSLDFWPDTFEYLKPFPFRPGTALAINHLLEELNHAVSLICHGNQQEFLSAWESLKPHFSDSSKSEKDKATFAKRMTFRHPISKITSQAFYHGKFQLAPKEPGRIHFPWPHKFTNATLPVPYVGPKLTKK